MTAAARIYCDEDVPPAVWKGLRRLGIECTSVLLERRLGLTDVEQLEFARENSLVVFTHNVGDFVRLHSSTLDAGGHHAGIIVCRQNMPVGEIIRRVARLVVSLKTEEMVDRLEYLGSW